MQDAYSNKYGGNRAILRSLAVAVALAVFVAGLGLGHSAPAVPTKKVLIIYPTLMNHPFYSDFTNSFKERLRAETSLNVEFYYESVDLLNYTDDEVVMNALAQIFQRKYGSNRPNLIVTFSRPAAIDFLHRYCGGIFAEVPVLVCYTRPMYIDVASLPANFTACYPSMDTAKNAELILTLQPSVRQLYVVVGASILARRIREELPHQLAPYAGRLDITYLNDLTLAQLRERVRSIEGPAAILFVDFVRDAADVPYSPARVVRTIAAEAPVPVFASHSTYVDEHGAVGGWVLNMNYLGRETGARAAVIIKGEAVPGKIETLNIAEYQFDWNELQRWRIAEAKLPPGSVILNKPPSLWQLYKWEIVVVGSLTVALMAVLTMLLMVHRRRLRDSEQTAELREEIIAAQENTIKERTSELERHRQGDLIATRGLYELSMRQVSQNNLNEVLEEVLGMAISLSGADMGNIQLLDRKDNSLKITVHRGFGGDFLEFFSNVHDGRGASCGEALTLRQRTIVEDVTESPIFVDTSSLDVMLAAGARACQSTPLVTRNGHLVGMLNTHFRKTIQKNELELSYIDLLAVQAADIIEAYQAIQAKEAELLRLDRLNTVGEMAAAIGHEVRNPLTTVRGYLQLFQRKDESVSYREHFNTMIEELDRANAIISDFLSLAKNKATDMRRGNVNDVVGALVPLLQAEALRTGHDLKTDMGEIPDFLMDEKEIRQLILNLTNNAFQAMEPGGKVTVATRATEDEVVLSVRDTGKGISREVLNKLGTPFLTTKENGTGLGLAVCYRIAERHGAKIDVKTSSQGTTFSVYFKNTSLKQQNSAAGG